MEQKDRTRSIECAGVVYLGRDALSPSSLTKRALQAFLSRMKQQKQRSSDVIWTIRAFDYIRKGARLIYF